MVYKNYSTTGTDPDRNDRVHIPVWLYDVTSLCSNLRYGVFFACPVRVALWKQYVYISSISDFKAVVAFQALIYCLVIKFIFFWITLIVSGKYYFMHNFL